MAKIAMVLPASNEEKGIQQALANVKAGIENFPEHEFTLFPIDDGSIDNTLGEIRRCSLAHNFKIRPHRNETNLGIVRTLKDAYARVLENGFDYVLKTDLDADFR